MLAGIAQGEDVGTIMAKSLTFYTNPMSRGRIARWMLEEVGEPYETQVLEYGTTMKSADYLAINPLGKVPTIRHGGQVVTECAAICAYLADAFPQAGLAPPPDRRGDYYRLLFLAAGPLEAAITNQSLGVQVPEERRGMVGYGPLPILVDTLAAALLGRDHIAGDTFSAADVYVGSHIAWGMRFGTLEQRPEFEAYLQRITSREAYRRAQALDDALLPEKPSE
jgi:glutathione S-transferase